MSLLTASSRELLTQYPSFDPALPVILVDFDGVLATNTWPSPTLGQPDEDAIRMVQHYAAEGCEVHVFTARPESHHQRIWAWLRGQQMDHLIYDVTRTKVAASAYFDDKAVRWPLSCG